jgi:hypothetical protein
MHCSQENVHADRKIRRSDHAEARLALADAYAAGGDTDAKRAYEEYVNFTRLAPKSPEMPRVKKLLPALKKRAARAP